MRMAYGIEWFTLGNDVRISVDGARFNTLACRMFYTRGHDGSLTRTARERGYYLSVAAFRDGDGRFERFADDSSVTMLLSVSRRSERSDAEAIRLANEALVRIVNDTCARAGGTCDLTGAVI